MIPLSGPDISMREIEEVVGVLRSGRLSIGPKLEEFERALAEYTGKRFAVGVSSGTAALHLALAALGVGAGDEVVTTPFSFVASANAALFVGAKPVFVDIDPETLNIDAGGIEKAIGEKTRLILPVDVFGLPCDMPAIMEIAEKRGVAVVEDAAEALGAEIGGEKAGSFGDVGVFGFYPNKQITTGEGGALLTDSEEVAKLASSMRNQGRGETSEWLEHERLGYNYRLDEMSAALGLAQIKRIEEILARRARVAAAYTEKLGEMDEVIVPSELAMGRMKRSWFVYVVRFAERVDRDEVSRRLHDAGVSSRPYFPPIHLLPFYRKRFGFKPGDFPITERVSGSTLALPFHGKLTEEEIDTVCKAVKEAIPSARRRIRRTKR